MAWQDFHFRDLSQLPALFYEFGYRENVGREDQSKRRIKRGKKAVSM